MERLSLLVALSVVLVAGTATVANAQALSGGSVYTRYSGARDIPLGTNEVGRFARFIGDERMLDRYDIQLSNRDYEQWKPLEVRSKEKMEHFMSGNLRVHHSLIPEQSTGRFARFVTNEAMMYNNMQFENRDFENFKVNGGTSRNRIAHHLRGLAAGTDIMPMPRGYVPVRVSDQAPVNWY
jgi:hypothetical protein